MANLCPRLIVLKTPREGGKQVSTVHTGDEHHVGAHGWISITMGIWISFRSAGGMAGVLLYENTNQGRLRMLLQRVWT